MNTDGASLNLKLARVLEALHEGFQVLDRQLRYVYLNQAALVHARKPREELLGRTMAECYPGIEDTPMYAALLACLKNGQNLSLQNEFEYPDRKRGYFELSVQPFEDGVVILSSDITHRNELQAQLRQAQKMDAIGRLAGGVAHDFNNLLTVIDSFTSLAMDTLDNGASAYQDLGEVRRATRQAAELTAKLLTFSRRRPRVTQIIQLDQVVSEMERMLTRLLSPASKLKLKLGEGLWPVQVDGGCLEQVLLNLVLNARDAMAGGGTVFLETYNWSIQEPAPLRWGREVPTGDYVVLAVTDQGTGISPENLEKIFEPFFTTKPAGHGTGLGLSVCLGIVEQSGGYIGVYSELNRGTTFRVYLPRAVPDEQRPHLEAPAPRSQGQGHIVIIEDEATILQVMGRILRNAGYRVTGVSEPERVVERMAQLEDVDLLISDLVMPKISGPELVATLRQTKPDLRVLYVSGYPGGMVADAQLIPPSEMLIEKPFGRDALLAAVHRILA